MKIEEFKDYLVDKKDNVINYLNSKKDSIKTGAKKAVATGLVVSTLLSGATMMTACDNDELPDDPSKATYEEVVQGLNKIVKKAGVDYSDITICDDIAFDKYMILFAEKDGKKSAYYEITKEQYEKFKAMALAFGQDDIEVRDRTISIPRDAISNNANLKALADEIYSNIKDEESSEYSLEGRYTGGLFHWWKDGDDAKTYFSGLYNWIYEDEELVPEDDDNYFNPAYCEFFFNNYKEGYTSRGYIMNVHGYYNSEKDDPNARMHVKNSKLFENVAMDGDLWSVMMTYLQNFEDGENIWCEDGRYFVNIDCFSDGKYKVLCELIRPMMTGSMSMSYGHNGEELDYDDIYYNEIVGKQFSLFPEEDQMTK